MNMKSLLCGFLAWAAAGEDGISLLQLHVASKRARQDPPEPQFVKPPPNAASDARAASGSIPGTHDLQFTTVSVNNLGGLGPDSTAEPVLRYDSCTEKAGRSVDCVVTAQQGYKAAKPEKNGVYGQLGNINLKNDAAGTFTISFVDSETNDPVALNEFFFSMFDMDTGSGWSTDGSQKPAENLEITGYKDLYKLPVDKAGSVKKMEDDTFTAHDHGIESDNPTDPFDLSTEQVGRTVQFVFPAGMSSFSFTYSNDKAGPGENNKGRNVLFGGLTNLYMCKVKKMNFDFDMAEVVRNNLGKMGPDFEAPEGILYEKIASVGGRFVDLEINAHTEYTVWNTSRNGKLGYYGQINLQTGSDVDVKFKLLVHGTQEPFVAEWLYFSVFDFDHYKTPMLWEESMTIANFSSFSVPDHSLVKVTELGEGAYVFTSTVRGKGSDNPDDPLRLTHEQMNKAVAFTFRDVSAFTMNFKVGPPELKTKGNTPDGRNFLFAGKSTNDACEMNAYDDVVNDPAEHNHDFSVVGPKFEDAGDAPPQDFNDVRMDDDTMKEEHEREEEEAEDEREAADQLTDMADEAEDEEVAEKLKEEAEEKEDAAEEIEKADVQEEAVAEKEEADDIKEEAEELEKKAEYVDDDEQAEEMKEQAEEMKEEADELEEKASAEQEEAVEEKKEEADDMEEEAKELEKEAADAKDEEEAEDLKEEAEELKEEAEEMKDEAEDFEKEVEDEDKKIEEEDDDVYADDDGSEEKKDVDDEEDEEKKDTDDETTETKPKTTTTTTEYNPWPTTTPWDR